MMQGLTPKEQKLFTFIESYQFEHGSSPTVREMRLFMGLKSDGFIVHCIKGLQTKGVIEKGDTPRSIKLLPAVADRLRADVVKLPVLGSVAAGVPITAQENIEGWMSITHPRLANRDGVFMLRVTGNSMIDAGIFEGDFVVVDSKRASKEKDIVIALVDGGSTVKRLIYKNSKPYLRAENPEYSDIVPTDSLEIQGVVMGLIRWY